MGIWNKLEKALFPGHFRWHEPGLMWLKLRRDFVTRLLHAGARACLCVAAFLATPMDPVEALCAGAIVGILVGLYALFWPDLKTKSVILKEDAMEWNWLTISYAHPVRCWVNCPYHLIARAVIVPGEAIGQRFSVLIVSTSTSTTLLGIPRRVDPNDVGHNLAERGVAVTYAREIPPSAIPPNYPKWLLPATWGAAVALAVVGLFVTPAMKAPGRPGAGNRPDLAKMHPEIQGARGPGPANPPAAGGVGDLVDLGRALFPKQPAAPADRPGRAQPQPLQQPQPLEQPQPGPEPGPGGPRSGVAGPDDGPFGPRMPGRNPRGMGSRPGLPPGIFGGPAMPGEAEPQPALPRGTGTKIIGGTGGMPYQAVGSGGPVLGFRYAMGSWAGEAALAELEPLYAAASDPAPQQVIARQGYAVGALEIDAPKYVSAVRIVFMRLGADGRLDPKDSYPSEWIGTPSGKPTRTVGGSGKKVIGLQARRAAVLDAVGLVME